MEQSPNSMFGDLLNDPEKLQSALSAAAGLFGGNGGATPPRPSAPSQPPPNAASAAAAPPPVMQPPFSAGAASARPAGNYDPSADLMRKVMPVLNSIAQSGRTAVNRDRANLLQSFKPFVTESVGSQFDHAIRLVSIARMTKDAMLQLGSTGQGTPPDGTKSL